MTDQKPSVLFLCVHNAGRSQMAAGFARYLGGDGLSVYSAGSEPADQVNPSAVAVMGELGIDITAQEPQRWTDDMVSSVDVTSSAGSEAFWTSSGWRRLRDEARSAELRASADGSVAVNGVHPSLAGRDVLDSVEEAVVVNAIGVEAFADRGEDRYEHDVRCEIG